MPSHNPIPMTYSPYRRRRSIRLPKYDYSLPGAYFITICTFQRQLLFGEVVSSNLQLNQYGHIAQDCWRTLPGHFSGVSLDAFVVMPNHVHGVLLINTVGAQHAAPLRNIPFETNPPPRCVYNASMALFDHQRRQRLQRAAPLASRMRPRTFDELVGQEHIVGPGRVLRRSIEADQVPSMVLWGPPGSGKTTLALIIAAVTQSHFEQVSAVTAGVADLRRIVGEARDRLGMQGQKTILFVDEIHRFNKAQQDVVLPHVEDGTVTFIGATTENPSFEVIAPLLSRSRVFALKPLTEEQVGSIVDRALADTEHGLGNMHVVLEPQARALLLTISNGDARVALNAIELAAAATSPDAQGNTAVSLATMEDALQQRALLYDKKGDQHYDTISAFIKSVRASDPDAAIYWLGRMIESGEDPLFIARRIVILAAEDIGMADPQALPVAVAAQQAVHFVGMPEGAIPLAEATVYLATAPKSNSANAALIRALEDARRSRNDPVPLHLRNPVTPMMKNMGYGQGYRYAHSYPEHFAGQTNLPDNLKGRVYYEPSDQGYEKQVAERIRRWWGERKGQPPATDSPHPS